MRNLRDHPERAAPPPHPDLVRGLSDTPRRLPYRLLWDDHNTALYDRIRARPEYYVDRLETGLLHAHAPDIVAAAGAGGLLDLGSGTGSKALILLGQAHAPSWFAPVDVSAPALARLAERFARHAPDIAVHPLEADFTRPWPDSLDRAPRPLLVALLGGTLGNFTGEERRDLLTHLGRMLRPGDTLLLGVPLRHDVEAMRSAYDDRAGLMVEFYRHCLRILNRDHGTDFDLDAYGHHVGWSARHHRVEIGLQARADQRVHVPGVPAAHLIRRGEVLRAVVAARFTRSSFTAELARHGFRPLRWHAEETGRYALALVGATTRPIG
ncbi:L-histidine N(alpha)-methyltransferase [Umezawaea sp. Da 62-37]|uniref:L-histidine N(alpha)-methyltransferase n=1 Tax=Umezawaea sp. Da 62-37 TaxID=3075927 RepID=UPI0028F71E77|nr:L-histidine N(alpha)-methyltransferase [Umezawaea sp. Da 62-37]WNV82283.1 L-histidine N(alpha)-methyltransferase [Umezawaea sp. Da 62-37]